MRRMIAAVCVLTVVFGGVWAQQSYAQSAPQLPTMQVTTVHKTGIAKKKKKASKSGTAPIPAQPAQTMPPMPATLMNRAPVAPRVTFESGQLTIDAPNSTLSDVLSGVHNATGASIEGASPSERVAVKLGPGDPEQVIAALLRGTAYDYVILGSLGRQDVVTRVLLSQQTASAPEAASRPAQSPPQTQQQPPTDDGMPDRTAPDDAATQPNGDTQPDQAQQAPQQQDPNQPKTPEQLFKELQQLEQQKQPK